MTSVLIVQGAGMDLRGRENVEIFGPETLEEIDAQIREQAANLGLQVEIWQHNDEAELVEALAGLADDAFDAMIINPSGFTPTDGPLPDAIAALGFPALEVHASNPAARGVRSMILPACKGGICGFGYAGYGIALAAIAAR